MEPNSSSATHQADDPQTVEEIFTDYSGRRAGLICALTRDVDTFHALCDPEKEDLCLYGYPNESWKVSLPEAVPPKIPDPAPGINFARNGMDRKRWLFFVAMHSDSSLICVAFFYASSSLHATDRNRLFTLINNLPTVYEVVTQWLAVQDNPKDKSSEASGSKSKDKSSEARGSKSKDKSTEASGSKSKDKNSEASGSKSKDKSSEASGSKSKDKSSEASGSKSWNPLMRSSDGPSTSTSNMVEESHVESEEGQEDTQCGSCGKLYHEEDEFWIGCDVCELWYHGECVNVTSKMADDIGKYACPSCALKRSKP